MSVENTQSTSVNTSESKNSKSSKTLMLVVIFLVILVVLLLSVITYLFLSQQPPVQTNTISKVSSISSTQSSITSSKDSVYTNDTLKFSMDQNQFFNLNKETENTVEFLYDTKMTNKSKIEVRVEKYDTKAQVDKVMNNYKENEGFALVKQDKTEFLTISSKKYNPYEYANSEGYPTTGKCILADNQIPYDGFDEQMKVYKLDGNWLVVVKYVSFERFNDDCSKTEANVDEADLESVNSLIETIKFET